MIRGHKPKMPSSTLVRVKVYMESVELFFSVAINDEGDEEQLHD
jgi:hypothetical protein